MSKIKDFWEKNKKGIITGAFVGLGVAWYIGSTGGNLDFVLQSAGVVDNLVSVGKTSTELAQTKVGIAYILIGGVIGGLVSDMKK